MNTITIQNITDYSQQIINGNMVLTRINPFIDEPSLFKKNLRGSSIVECKINNINLDINKYKKLVIHLYYKINVETILQYTKLNISREERYDKGFEYYKHLGLSIQGADARRTLNEIINIIKLKHYNMELKIKLKPDEIICFSI